jgi:hypothetical protein
MAEFDESGVGETVSPNCRSISFAYAVSGAFVPNLRSSVHRLPAWFISATLCYEDKVVICENGMKTQRLLISVPLGAVYLYLRREMGGDEFSYGSEELR